MSQTILIPTGPYGSRLEDSEVEGQLMSVSYQAHLELVAEAMNLRDERPSLFEIQALIEAATNYQQAYRVETSWRAMKSIFNDEESPDASSPNKASTPFNQLFDAATALKQGDQSSLAALFKAALNYKHHENERLRLMKLRGEDTAPMVRMTSQR